MVQAALSGYSDWAMRVIARRLGASYALCEVMLDQFLIQVRRRQRTRHFLYLSDEDHPVGGQLMGAEPEQFAAGTVRLVDAGFDVIDINFGCPVKKVVGKCRGGFHLKSPGNRAGNRAAYARGRFPIACPLLSKCGGASMNPSRAERSSTKSWKERFRRVWLPPLFMRRSVEQRYVGPSDWTFLKEVKQHIVTKPFWEVVTCSRPPTACGMMHETGVDGVTVARGAIGNPWIFSQVRALAEGRPAAVPDLAEQQSVIREHYRLAEQLYGPERCGALMRKFGIKYAQLHPQQNQVRDAFVQVRSREDWEQVLAHWYGREE